MNSLTRLTATSSALLVCLFALIACGANEAGTRVGNPPTTTVTTSELYPEEFAVTSPLETSSEFTTNLPTLVRNSVTSQPTGSARVAAIERINDILSATGTASGSDASICAPLLKTLLMDADDATCYGPSVAYEKHPDFTPPEFAPQNYEDGELPPGDVGIWTETEDGTDQACAAAQLNHRMRSVAYKSQAAMETFASLVCVANDKPAAGETLTLTDSMNSMATSAGLDAVFSLATLSAETTADGLTYSYDVEFVYTDTAGDAHPVVLRMSYTPAATDTTTYQGQFSYLIGDNQSLDDAGCPSSDDFFDAGSVVYTRDGSERIRFEARQAGYCSSSGSSFDPIGDDGLLDTSEESATNPNGWQHNFTVTLADYSPTTEVGNFVLAWQAGSDDGNSRVANVTLNESEGEGTLSGDAWFGYGDDIASFDGSIKGIICNWAGPGSTHTLQNHAQHQGIVFDATAEAFTSTADTLNIGYAPTNSCSYDGTGSFSLDSDSDGTADTDPSLAIENDLLPLTDADGDGIFDEFAAAGFVLPEAP